MLRGGAPEKLDGAAFDLGVCSTQLDQADRGFSFRFDGPLDMRMSKSGASAADIVMHSDASDLAQILWEYGEEKASRRIAKAIVKARGDTTISTTNQLATIIHSVSSSIIFSFACQLYPGAHKYIFMIRFIYSTENC